MVKYVFVTGGVVSGLGKGITAASTAQRQTWIWDIMKDLLMKAWIKIQM